MQTSQPTHRQDQQVFVVRRNKPTAQQRKTTQLPRIAYLHLDWAETFTRRYYQADLAYQLWSLSAWFGGSFKTWISPCNTRVPHYIKGASLSERLGLTVWQLETARKLVTNYFTLKQWRAMSKAERAEKVIKPFTLIYCRSQSTFFCLVHLDILKRRLAEAGKFSQVSVVDAVIAHTGEEAFTEIPQNADPYRDRVFCRFGSSQTDGLVGTNQNTDSSRRDSSYPETVTGSKDQPITVPPKPPCSAPAGGRRSGSGAMGNPPSQATVETKPETTLLPVEVVQAPSVPVAAEQQVATAFSDAGANADAQGIQDPAQWADDELPIAGEMLDAWTTSALAETKTAPDLPGYEQTALDNMGSGDVWFCPTTAWLAGVSGNRHTRMLTAAIGQHYLRFAQANFTDTPGSAVAFEKPWTADSLLGQMEEGFSRLCDPRNIRPVARHAKDWVFAKEDPAGIAALRIFANGAPVTTRDLRLFARLRRNGEIPNSALLSLIVEPKKIMNAVYERYPNSRRELVNCIRLAMRVLHDRDRDDDAAAVIYRHFGNRDAMTAEFAAFEDMDAAVLAGDADKAFMEAIRVGQKALKRRLYVQPWLRAIWNRVIPAFFLEHCYPERLWLADVRTAHAHVLNLYSLFNNAK